MESDGLQGLRDYFDRFKNDPEFADKERVKFAAEKEANNRPKTRALKMINSLNDDEFKEFMIKVFVWEEKYEEMWYKRAVLTSSRLLSSISSLVWGDLGEELEIPEDEYFMANKSSYKGFIFELFIGQGSFYRIYHENDESIYFQTK